MASASGGSIFLERGDHGLAATSTQANFVHNPQFEAGKVETLGECVDALEEGIVEMDRDKECHCALDFQGSLSETRLD